ncbi:hypothetical protein PGIGA_G00125860 [Pangasianodon gigas]|uniref:Uncharacterized protein n=1 Tax=Pangasianodon gigas TaxID=30993 RepID=A0ACC5XHW1_PANGG|nr:hypothetical protein [Pangasianodon gigas]
MEVCYQLPVLPLDRPVPKHVLGRRGAICITSSSGLFGGPLPRQLSKVYANSVPWSVSEGHEDQWSSGLGCPHFCLIWDDLQGYHTEVFALSQHLFNDARCVCSLIYLPSMSQAILNAYSC